MKKLIAGLMIAAGVAWGANEDFAFRLPAEIQTAGPVSLEELTWQQGSTPLIRVDVLQRGKAVAADTNTTVRMIIAPTGTGTYYAVSTNYLTTNTSYYVQWPTIGTNSLDTNGVQSAWFYTVYFERDSKRYWTGSGELYIEHTTSTDPDGLVWQEFTTGVRSIFGRDGIVTGRAADYAEFYLQPGAAGTSTNLTDYNNDAGFITTAVAAPVDSVFGRTGVVVAVSSDYAAFYAALSHTHPINQVVGLQAALDGKAGTGAVAVIVADLAAHELETTGAHGGIVASTDSRLTDARVPLAHTQGWHTITGTPDSVSGYGITNPIIYEGDSRLTDARTPLPHNQGWSTITNTPDTISGYGITDAWTRVESDGRYGSTSDVAQVATDLSDHESATGTSVHGLGTMSIQSTGDYYNAGTVDGLLNAKAGTASVAAVAADLSSHEGLTGTAVHGLGTMSTQGTGSYYTAAAADLLLAAKAGTATVAAIDGRVGTLESGTSTWYKGATDAASATASVATAQADISILQTQKLNVVTFDGFTNSLGSMAFEDSGNYATTGTVGAIDERVSTLETGKLDVVTAASTYATTGTVGAIDGRVSIVETGKLDIVTAASTYATTGTVGAIDTRVSVMETGKVDYVNATYTDTVAKAASALQTESYLGTITGVTIAAGSSDSVVVTGPNAAITWDTNAAAGSVVAYGITAGTAYEGMNGAAASNLAYSASTNAEAARQIGTNAQELAVVVSNQLYQGPLISGNNDIIIGSGASGDGINTVAIGDDAYAYTGVAIGSQAKAYYRYATAIGWGAVATNYGVAVGKGSYATNSSVALGADVENTVAGTTRIKGDLEMAGEDVLGVGTLTTTNLAITGGAVNGGVWVCTNSVTGEGTWVTNRSAAITLTTQTTNETTLTVTGVGFRANRCQVIGSVQLSNSLSTGFVDENGNQRAQALQYNGTPLLSPSKCLRLYHSSGGGWNLQHTGWTDDGATFVGIKENNPTTNNVTIYLLFER